MHEPGELITLRDGEGQIHEYTLVDVVEVDGYRYAVLQPSGEEAAVVFRVQDDTLVPIDDDGEFDRVVDALEASEDYDDITLVDGEPRHPTHRRPESD